MKKLIVWYDELEDVTRFYIENRFRDKTIIGEVNGNDADWRGEYLNPIMKQLDIEVIEI